jgi:murein DD-endopeptidase MepM/ murein hydrolase activator NlpD
VLPAAPPASLSSASAPEDVYQVLRSVLQVLVNRLPSIEQSIERREALAAATPSIWPAQGWLTASFGERSDPFTGERGFHQGIDISTAEGQPVYATADGVVESASYSGDYGNLVVLQHGFGLSTRYGHLTRFAAVGGEFVKRGDTIGYVGATGRATGPHLHYEILVSGTPIDPLQMLTAGRAS